jgi:Myb-like DNA-binding domain
MRSEGDRNTDPHDAVMKAKMEEEKARRENYDEDDNDLENNDLNFAEFISRADLGDPSNLDKNDNNPNNRQEDGGSSNLANINNGRWTDEEHDRFCQALKMFGKDWNQIQDYIGTRTSA